MPRRQPNQQAPPLKCSIKFRLRGRNHPRSSLQRSRSSNRRLGRFPDPRLRSARTLLERVGRLEYQVGHSRQHSQHCQFNQDRRLRQFTNSNCSSYGSSAAKANLGRKCNSVVLIRPSNNHHAGVGGLLCR